MVRLKLRPDTPQHYENIHFRDITLDSSEGAILDVQPWGSTADLNGRAPKSSVRNVTLTNFKGRYGSFGVLQGTPGQTVISGITLENIEVQLEHEELKVSDEQNLKMKNVTINGKSVSPLAS